MREGHHRPKSLTDAALWLLDLTDEVASDLSVYHRIDDWESMSARRYCRLVPLLPAYGGAVAAALRRMLREAQEAQSTPQAQAAVAPRPALFSRATSGGEAA